MTSSNKLEVLLEDNYFDSFVESSLECIEQYYEHNHSLNNDVIGDVLLDEYLELELNDLLESNGIFYIFENMDELELEHFDTNYINTKETKYNENCHHYNCVINEFLDNVIKVSKTEYVNILKEIDIHNDAIHDEPNDDNKSIISNVTKKSENSVLSDDSLNEIFKSLCEYLEECMEDDEIMILMIEPDVYDLLFDLLEEYVNLHYDDFISINDIDNVYNIIDDTIEWYFTMVNVPRSYDSTYILKKVNKEYVEQRLKYLENVYQPEQKSEEWYNYRNNLITASDAHCAFGSEAVKNSLIYQKCNAYIDAKFKKQTDSALNNNYYILNKVGVNGCLFEFSDDSGDDMNVTIDDKEPETKTETKTVYYGGLAKEEKNDVMPVFVNTNSTLHWGNKYEPISVLIYEHMFNTKVGLFGCIKHEKYNFLGASPDGINVDKENERYGRMLEIKNIVNREINGIPKKEYWIQMQIQMETCELEECDFLETKFYECENEQEYEELNDSESNMFDKTYKGIIMWFVKETTEPYYVYVPLEYTISNTNKTKDELEEWMNKKKEEELKNNNIFGKLLYWKLEKLSCVLVPRNKLWFNAAIKCLSKIWKTIEIEREGDFEHRKPVKNKQRNMFIECV
jgi:hypothetical protein